MNEEYQGKSLVELLDMLEPVPEPERVSMMPQTAGWLVLALVGLVLGWLALRVFLKHHHANAYRRAALAELDHSGDDPALIAPILRRTALAAYPRAEVAGLHGADWAAFLDRTAKGSSFSSETGLRLVSAPYTQTSPSSVYSKMARDWILGHERAGS